MKKKRILFVGEASPLKTGFSTYYYYILRKIHNTGLFDIAEFGSYMSSNDPRAAGIPWKFYGNLPDIVGTTAQGEILNPEQDAEYQGDYRLNQFGKWRFDKVVADFKPDFVCDIRDNWMIEWQLKTPFRQNFKLVWMPTVDGAPQLPQWIKDYETADAIFTYSKFGEEVLTKESDGKIKVLGVPSPGVDTDIFTPLSKQETRKELGIPENSLVIGTVMRNQHRKLFCELILSYKKLLKFWNDLLRKNKNSNVKIPYLLLHTGVPDVGWDISLEVKRNNLNNFVLFSYICPNCRYFWVSNWSGFKTNCKNCGCPEASTPNTNVGVSSKQLAKIYNSMDVYVQTSVCEGWGLPISEAKACGIPVLGVDWTAMSEQVHAPGALPIKVKSLFTDPGTMQRRALFDEDDLVQKLIRMLKDYNEDKRLKIGTDGRNSVLNSWDKAARIWIEFFLKEQPLDRSKTWEKPIEIVDLNLVKVPLDISYEDSIRWMYKNILLLEPNEEVIQKFKKENVPIDEIEKNFRKRGLNRNNYERLRSWGLKKADSVVNYLDETDTFRILYVMPKSAGDVLLSTAVIEGIALKWPKASIYFATEPKYATILKGNKYIKKVLNFEKGLLNYRLTEGCAQDKGYFDITFNPYIVTQEIPHSWHNGHGKHLIDIYADMCGVKAGKVSIQTEQFTESLPKEYITIHTGSSFDIKNYDYMQAVIEYFNIPVIHVGGEKDPKLNNVIDLRGKTTPGQLANIISGSKFHLGVDSFPAHVAAAVKTDVFTLFGSTFSNNCKPRTSFYGSHLFGMVNESESIVIEPENRWDCVKPCHLEQCTQVEKCINNIKPTRIIDEIKKTKHKSFIKELPPIKLSAYLIALNAIESGFQIEDVINNCRGFADEIIVVDGGSTDGTWDKLLSLAADEEIAEMEDGPVRKLFIYQNAWDYNRPDMMGIQKTFARQKCTGNYLWQTDLDEFVPEWQFKSIRKLIKDFPHSILFDLPCITFSGGLTTVGRTENFYKWRLSKNIPGIIHGVHKEARKIDQDGNLVFDREVSDSCEYIWEQTGEIVKRFAPIDKRLWFLNLKFMDNEIPDQFVRDYSSLISELANGLEIPCVFHYAWVDYKRKAQMAKFWSKQKKTYAKNGKGTREGKWLDKEDVNEEDIQILTKKFYQRKTFPVSIKNHPNTIIDHAKKQNWNQSELFNKNQLMVVN